MFNFLSIAGFLFTIFTLPERRLFLTSMRIHEISIADAESPVVPLWTNPAKLGVTC
jgi:hypothetical protein